MTEEDLKNEWVLRNRIVCLCKRIPRKRFLAAIDNGAASLLAVNRAVGSGSGDCKGKRCAPKIEELLRARRSSKGSG